MAATRSGAVRARWRGMQHRWPAVLASVSLLAFVGVIVLWCEERPRLWTVMVGQRQFRVLHATGRLRFSAADVAWPAAGAAGPIVTRRQRLFDVGCWLPAALTGAVPWLWLWVRTKGWLARRFAAETALVPPDAEAGDAQRGVPGWAMAALALAALALAAFAVGVILRIFGSDEVAREGRGILDGSFLSLLACVVALMIWIKARNERIARRRAAGLCPSCGYDLRAGHDRCPECGAKAGPDQPAGLRRR